MHKTIFTLTAIICLALFKVPAYAQPVVLDADGSSDLDFLNRYRESGIVRYDRDENSDFVFALARVRKLNNRWQAEQERRLNGTHTSITYRAPNRAAVKDVFEHFRVQIIAAGFAELFACSGRSCGDSNKWANVIYGEKRLYGPDANQHYLVTERDNQLLALYVIKRGNKRVYARIDLLVPSHQGEKSWQQQLQAERYVRLPAAMELIRDQAPALRQLVDWLSSSGKKVYVVGHAYGGNDVTALKSKSLDTAVLLRRRLIELGADASLVEAHGIGPLAPAEQRAEDRLELLLIE